MILEEFLQSSGMKKRWEEHEKFILEQQSQGIGGGFRNVAATFGIALEPAATLGKGTTGHIAASIGYENPGFSEFTDRAYLAAVAAGGNNKDTSFGQSIAAGVAANEGAAHVNPYITGVANMLLDPTNVIPTGPASKLKEAKKLRLAKRLGAGAELSSEFIARGADVPVGAGIASDVEEKLAVAALGFGNSGEKAAANIGKSVEKANKARVKAAKPAVRSIAAAAKGFDGVGEEVAGNFAQSRLLQEAGEGLLLDIANGSTKGEDITPLLAEYKKIQQQAKNALELKDFASQNYHNYKDMQKGMIRSWEEEGMDSFAAKAWFEELADEIPKAMEGLRNPQPGETWREYVNDANKLYYQLHSAEKNLYRKVRAAYDAPEISSLTGEQGDALVGPEALELARLAEISSPKYGKALRESASAGSGIMNDRENALEIANANPISNDKAIALGLKDFVATPPDPAQKMLNMFPGTKSGDWAPAQPAAAASPQTTGKKVFLLDASGNPQPVPPGYIETRPGVAEELVTGAVAAAPSPSPAGFTPLEQKVLQLASDIGRTPTASEVQRELKVGYNEAARLSDVASGKLPGTASSMPPIPADAPAGVQLQAVASTPPDSPQAIRTTLNAVTNPRPLPTAPEAAPFISMGEDSQIGRMSEFVRALLASTLAAQKDSFTRKGVGVVGTLKAIPSVWSGIQTQTVRNLLMDPIWNRVLLQHEGLGQSTYQEAGKVIMRRLTVGEKNEARLFGGIADTGGIHEWVELMGDEKGLAKFNTEWKRNIGGSAWEIESEGAMRLNAMEQLAASIPILLANPTRAVTNLALAPLGLLAESRQHAFHIINSITHTAARSAAFESAYVPFMENSAKRLLAAAAAEGRDVSGLAGRAMKSAGRDLGTEGGFSPTEVAAILGDRYANEWRSMIEQGRQAGFTETKRVFGDFYNRGPVEKALSKFLPFMSWTWRAYPRMMNMVGEHPLLAATLYQLYRTDAQLAKKEQRKNYQYGTLSINKDTKVVGLLAGLFSPEQEGELRFNPLSLISPVGGEQIGMAAGEGENPLSADASWNEKAYRGITDTLNVIGTGVNPFTQAGAYVTGSDYKSPGAASRYAAIDNLMSQYSPTDVATIQGPMRGLREALTGDKDNYDPIANKAKELIYQRTGKPANHKDNRQLAAQLAARTGIYEEAQEILDVSGARRAAFNANSPMTLMLNTDSGEEIRKAKKGLPFTYDDIQQAKAAGIPGIAQYMANANEEYKMKNPAAYAQDTPATIKKR